jgi:nucleotide-binding universal stress UspA family protein
VTGPEAGPAGRARHPAAEERERVLLVAGGDAATAAAARWVARRADRRALDVVLIAVPDARHADSLERTAAVLRAAAPALRPALLAAAGDPRRAFAAASVDADLLVVGTNRVTPFAHVLPPTLAVHLAEAASCPVVLVPRDWESGPGPVVVGATDDGTDAAALRFAAEEAVALGRPLHVVHVWRLSQVVTPVFVWALDTNPVRAAHAERLARVVARVRTAHPGLEVTTELVHGEASVEVVSAGAGAELVVVGSHGWSGVDRVLLRSVGRALAERPPCPVAVVRPRDREAS